VFAENPYTLRGELRNATRLYIEPGIRETQQSALPIAPRDQNWPATSNSYGLLHEPLSPTLHVSASPPLRVSAPRFGGAYRFARNAEMPPSLCPHSRGELGCEAFLVSVRASRDRRSALRAA